MPLASGTSVPAICEFDCSQELLSLPGMFVSTFDSCQYGEDYRYRQMLITSQPWLSYLSRGCPGNHEHATISGSGIPTYKVAAFDYGLVSRWAELFARFVKAPRDLICAHCADDSGRIQQERVATAVDRVAHLLFHREVEFQVNDCWDCAEQCADGDAVFSHGVSLKAAWGGEWRGPPPVTFFAFSHSPGPRRGVFAGNC